MLEETLAQSHRTVAPVEPSKLTIKVAPSTIGRVIVVDGSDTCTVDPRNRSIARLLRQRGFETLLIDRSNLKDLCDFVRASENSGLFVSESGLDAVCDEIEIEELEKPLVIKGGPSAKTIDRLIRSYSPTLMVVGAHDSSGLHAANCLLGADSPGVRRLDVVPGAKRGFSEPGTLAAATFHASSWYLRHLTTETKEAVR